MLLTRVGLIRALLSVTCIAPMPPLRRVALPSLPSAVGCAHYRADSRRHTGQGDRNTNSPDNSFFPDRHIRLPCQFFVWFATD